MNLLKQTNKDQAEELKTMKEDNSYLTNELEAFRDDAKD